MADLATDNLRLGQKVGFTFYWVDTCRWESRTFQVRIVA